MSVFIKIGTRRTERVVATCSYSLLVLGILALAAAVSAAPPAAVMVPSRIQAFQSGESLTYDVSWSKAVKAGTAVMEVQGEQLPSGKDVFRFIVTSRTVGAVGRFYPLGDTVQSVFDPRLLQSLSYRLDAKHGKRSRRLEVTFDHARRSVTSRLNGDPPKSLNVPDRVQDSLSALYYLRTLDDFVVGRPIVIEVFDGSRNRSIEVQTLGREKVKTPAGEFATIKVTATRGIFLGDGEVFFWLTDDSRKIPVLIKSRIAIGAMVFTLRELRPGGYGGL